MLYPLSLVSYTLRDQQDQGITLSGIRRKFSYLINGTKVGVYCTSADYTVQTV